MLSYKEELSGRRTMSGSTGNMCVLNSALQSRENMLAVSRVTV